MTIPPPDDEAPYRLFLLTRSGTFLGMVADVLEQLATQMSALQTVEECRALLVGKAAEYREIGRR